MAKKKSQEVEKEVRALAAETLATQMVLGQILFHLTQIDPRFKVAILHGFDDAANIVENVAIQMGTSAHPGHAVRAIQIVEELRTMVLGDGGKPKHGV